jgi:hypothetical protein
VRVLGVAEPGAVLGDRPADRELSERDEIHVAVVEPDGIVGMFEVLAARPAAHPATLVSCS